MAFSYLIEAKTEKIAINEEIYVIVPKSSGTYRREITGDARKVITWAVAFPANMVETLRIKPPFLVNLCFRACKGIKVSDHDLGAIQVSVS